MNDAATAAAGAGVLFFGIFFVCGVVLFFMWIYSLVDIIKSDYENPSNKTMWIILMLFLAPIATILYLFIGEGQKAKKGDHLKTMDARLAQQFCQENKGKGPKVF